MMTLTTANAWLTAPQLAPDWQPSSQAICRHGSHSKPIVIPGKTVRSKWRRLHAMGLGFLLENSGHKILFLSMKKLIYFIRTLQPPYSLFWYWILKDPISVRYPKETFPSNVSRFACFLFYENISMYFCVLEVYGELTDVFDKHLIFFGVIVWSNLFYNLFISYLHFSFSLHRYASFSDPVSVFGFMKMHFICNQDPAAK